MGDLSHALDTETPPELRSFDEAVLGWGGTLLCAVGVLLNAALVPALRRLRHRIVYNVVLAVADIVFLVVWGTYYSLTYLTDVLRPSSLRRDDFNSSMEPLADFVQTLTAWLLVALVGDAFASVAKSDDWRRRWCGHARVVVNVIVVIVGAFLVNLPKILAFRIHVSTSMSWSSPHNATSVLLADHALYVWIYDYILSYLLRFILPFIAVAVVVLRANLALRPGSARRGDVMNIGAALFALLCYAPFLVNYAIYAAWVLHDERGVAPSAGGGVGGAAAATGDAIAGDIPVRKFNTFCYVFIMAASALRGVVYAAFNPALRPRKCRGGGEEGAEGKLFGAADVDRYGRNVGGDEGGFRY